MFARDLGWVPVEFQLWTSWVRVSGCALISCWVVAFWAAGPAGFVPLWRAIRHWQVASYACSYYNCYAARGIGIFASWKLGQICTYLTDCFDTVLYLNLLQIVFERFDRDRSGTIERNELQEALLSLGLDIPPQVLHILVSTFDTTGHGRSIQYDNFIEYVICPIINPKPHVVLDPVLSFWSITHSEPKSIWGMSGFWLSHTVVVLLLCDRSLKAYIGNFW